MTPTQLLIIMVGLEPQLLQADVFQLSLDKLQRFTPYLSEHQARLSELTAQPLDTCAGRIAMLAGSRLQI